jgi:hypothetical protein
MAAIAAACETSAVRMSILSSVSSILMSLRSQTPASNGISLNPNFRYKNNAGLRDVCEYRSNFSAPIHLALSIAALPKASPKPRRWSFHLLPSW